MRHRYLKFVHSDGVEWVDCLGIDVCDVGNQLIIISYMHTQVLPILLVLVVIYQEYQHVLIAIPKLH